ncbi:hypothetical protein HYPSUDRAFT_43178 [Hypholoma sublateritium FD-334 SS-4]|uniref:Uncharacterized protein n=1 Tax=Hypholoma sublateritium (strain FD-334 SS-4) TaxID=945553 RepID=A0A0D2PKG1_HYPSF|nr:hypothetical protein HYPSUDRAFT_43178 [Hypholoma sublateritium FD-334 SS-4]
MPSHSKPVVSDDGSTVSVSVNPQTLITIFGVATSTHKQKVQAELRDANSAVKSASTFDSDGEKKESLYIEADNTKKAIVWGPFDAQTTVTLSFSHLDDDDDDSDGGDDAEPSWTASGVVVAKMKEHSTDDLQTAISLIPVDDGENEDRNYQNTIFNVTRMTLF